MILLGLLDARCHSEFAADGFCTVLLTSGSSSVLPLECPFWTSIASSSMVLWILNIAVSSKYAVLVGCRSGRDHLAVGGSNICIRSKLFADSYCRRWAGFLVTRHYNLFYWAEVLNCSFFEAVLYALFYTIKFAKLKLKGGSRIYQQWHHCLFPKSKSF